MLQQTKKVATTQTSPPATEMITRLPAGQRPILLVVVDTEEEFCWGVLDRQITSVSAMREIHTIQVVFDEFGIRPIYVVDYPVATHPESIAPLREIVNGNRAELGAHLHPWVNPPHDEIVCGRNSFPGNLEYGLERAKLRTLAQAIETNLGVRPAVYKAGRYGFGINTPRILKEEGFEVDVSISPAFDWRKEGGPDFSDFPCDPYWLDTDRTLLEIPTTGAFVGFLRRAAPGVHRWVNSSFARWVHLGGIFARIGAIKRLRLSPEGFSNAEQRELTTVLLKLGVRTFSFSFHSPSLKPGCTPYVQDHDALRRFVDDCRRYFDFFLGDLDGIVMTATELKQYLSQLVSTM